MDMVEKFLRVSPEAVNNASKDEPLQIDVDAEEAFGMKLRIQVLEACGQEDALKLNILNRNKVTGEVMGLSANQKRSRDTKEPVMVNGKPVYRKTRLVAKDSDAEDVLVTAVAPVAPVEVPAATAEEASDNVGELF
jgi:hypothetical protein